MFVLMLKINWGAVECVYEVYAFSFIVVVLSVLLRGKVDHGIANRAVIRTRKIPSGCVQLDR